MDIYADVPADPEDPDMPWSHPGELLWSRVIDIADVTVKEIIPDPEALEGWYDPVTGEIIPEDHATYFAYNIVEIPDPFYQEQDTIYWLFICANVQAPPDAEWGWKTADMDQYPPPHTGDHYQDNAVVTGIPGAPPWVPLFDPLEPAQSLDLAFVITGRAVPAVSEWGLVVMIVLVLTAGAIVIGRRRRLTAA